MEQHSPEEEKPIAGQITYFNILAQSIQRINDSIMQEKDARDAAENLLSDLPQDWTDEVKLSIASSEKEYDDQVKYWNKYLRTGTRESTKNWARHEIYIAGKKYGRSIKKIVISLLKEKDLLYQTRNKVEQGFYLKEDDE